MNLPKDRKYSEHVWIKKEGDIAVLGVTDYAVAAAKEIVFIELPRVGDIIKKGDVLTSLESVKWSGHVESPVTGEILEVNEQLFDEPERLNRDPYGSWICKMRLIDQSELDSLMDSRAAEMWTKRT